MAGSIAQSPGESFQQLACCRPCRSADDAEYANVIRARGPGIEALPDGLPEYASDAIAVNGIAEGPRSRDGIYRVFNGFK